MSKSVKLNNGHDMPILGLGTWLAQPGEVKLAVENALNLGYKHIDCAWMYENENEIGEAIENAIKSGKVKREDLFVTSKLWNSFHQPEMVHKGIEDTLKKLNLNYLDLYLIHWPISIKPGNKIPSQSAFKDEIDDVDLAKTWQEMEKLVDSGKTKSIGISNFNIKQIQHILDHCRIKPAVNQIELHVYLPNKKLVEFCLKNEISVTAYSPLGGAVNRPGAEEGEQRPLNDPEVVKIAKKLNVTTGQILINYVLHRGLICIPKSVSSSRLAENLKAADIKLSDEDFTILDNLNVNHRMCDPQIFKLHKNYPFYED